MGIFGFGPRDEKWYRLKLEENLFSYKQYVEYAKRFLNRPASPNLSRAIADISTLREKIDSLIREMDPSYRFKYREPSQKKYEYEDLLEKYGYAPGYLKNLFTRLKSVQNVYLIGLVWSKNHFIL